MTQTILISGGSGFLAAHIIDTFLDANFNVKTTVRSQAIADRVRGLYPGYDSKLSFVIVPDISQAGAFDEAVKGVDGVIHTASPFILNAEDFEKDLYAPAETGTLSVLEAVKKGNDRVKRIVITGSFAAVKDLSKGPREGYSYTENDFSPMTKEVAKEAGAAAAYCVSKALAEKAALTFVEKEQPKFSVTILEPPVIYGPVTHSVTSLSSLNTSAADIYRFINGSLDDVPPTSFFAWVDVRDVAKAHLLAYQSQAAANQRYLISGGSYTYQKVADTIREKFPNLQGKVPMGDPSQPFPNVYQLDTSKAQRDLGMNKYFTWEETITDMTKSLLALEQKLRA